ncbi:Ldh family oxidoreductase [Pseudomonas amygdali]
MKPSREMALSEQALLDRLPIEHREYVERFLEYSRSRSDDAHGVDIILHQMREGLLFSGGIAPAGRHFNNSCLVGVLSAKRCAEHLCASLADLELDYVVCDKSAHIGAIGFHLREIARKGHIAIGFQSTHPVMSVGDLAERQVGNNLLALALPGDDGVSLSFETSLGVCSVRQALAYATAQAFEGKVLVAQGEFADNAVQANSDGAILPMGGHKGAGLAIAIQFLMVLLTQQPVQRRPANLAEHCNNPFVFIGLRASKEATAFLTHQLARFREEQPSAYVPGTRYE